MSYRQPQPFYSQLTAGVSPFSIRSESLLHISLYKQEMTSGNDGRDKVKSLSNSGLLQCEKVSRRTSARAHTLSAVDMLLGIQ
jgi:hypothetical protein